MPQPRLFLHIGTQKTGTTSIQAALHAARADLLRTGFEYPETEPDDPHKESHYNSFRGFFAADERQIEHTRRFIARVSASRHHLILSAEALSAWPARGGRSLEQVWAAKADAVRRIRAAFPNHRPTVIMFTRERQAFLASLYRQHLHVGDRHDTSAEYAAFMAAEGHLTDYASELACWKASFEDVRVVDYDRISSSVEAFCDVVGIPRLNDVRENVTAERINETSPAGQ